MTDITKEDIWNSDYEKDFEAKTKRENRKIIMVGLIMFFITLTINVILIHSFFSLLGKI